MTWKKNINTDTYTNCYLITNQGGEDYKVWIPKSLLIMPRVAVTKASITIYICEFWHQAIQWGNKIRTNSCLSICQGRSNTMLTQKPCLRICDTPHLKFWRCKHLHCVTQNWHKNIVQTNNNSTSPRCLINGAYKYMLCIDRQRDTCSIQQQ